MTTWIKGVDLSVYQGAVPFSTWNSLKQQGYEIGVVGSAHPRPNPYAEDNLLNAKAAGMKIATYAALMQGVGAEATILTAKRMCGVAWEDILFVAIDVETEGITHQQIRDAERVIRAEGREPWLYTGQWFWVDRYGNPTTFRHLPLWTANYRTPPLSDSVPLYGGWIRDRVAGHQYAGTTNMHGTQVDLNNFNKDFIKEKDVTQAEVDRLTALNKVAEFFSTLATKGAKGQAATTAEKAVLRYLAG